MQACDVLKILKRVYPNPKIALKYGDAFQLLVAVMLSAQCTDKRVNLVTPALFARFPKVEVFANCEIEELEKMIFSTGFYRNKAKNIRTAAQKIVSDFDGRVPDKMEDLLSLPGVARKTANVILSTAFGKIEGIVVDTHVIRLSGLLGFVSSDVAKSKNAVKIENELMKLMPKEDWAEFSLLLILHGRNTCIARKPRCSECKIRELCPSAVLF